jgi:hypothetical protein
MNQCYNLKWGLDGRCTSVVDGGGDVVQCQGRGSIGDDDDLDLEPTRGHGADKGTWSHCRGPWRHGPVTDVERCCT